MPEEPVKINIAEFKRIALRIAVVREAKPHPNADKLLLLTVDAGAGPKQIVAGLRGHYEPEALVGRKIVLLDNMEPATIRGEQSNGMLLAATDPQTGAVRLLCVDGDAAVGSTVR
jgi:tRNA-binding protein